MPNPSKFVACCELAAQSSISTTHCNRPPRKWTLICGGPTSRAPQSPFTAQRWVRPVHSHANQLGAVSSTLKENNRPEQNHARRRPADTHLPTKPKKISNNKKPPAQRRDLNNLESRARSISPSDQTKFVLFRTPVEKRRYILQKFKRQRTDSGLSYVSQTAIPKHVKAATWRALRSLHKQGRAISKEAFRIDLKIATSSMFPFQGIPTWWITYFQDLFAKTADGKQETWQMPPRVDNFTSNLFNIIENNDIGSFKAVWKTLERNVKAAQWPLIALWLLRNSLSKIPEFLLATYSEPYPPFGMISDCLIFYNYYGGNFDRAAFKDVVLTCMDPERWPVIDLTQRGVRLYVKTADVKDAYRAFEIMRTRESPVSAFTILGFMNVFIGAGDVEKALECLRTIPAITPEVVSMNSESVVRHCCKLLQLDQVVEENGVRNFKILPQILELGVKPSLEMMNIVLSNAFATGDTHLGLDMLKYMKDQGMKFSSYTYMTLLKDAVARSDRERVDALLQEINTRDEFRNNKFIASKVFHAHFVFGVKLADWTRNPTGVFSDMLGIYSRYYDLTPLRDLNIIPERYKVESKQEIHPSGPVLFIMLATYLRMLNKTAEDTLPTYRRFRELVDARHPLIAPLVKYPQLFNEFILSFRYGDPDLTQCVAIVEDMLNPSSEPFIIDGRLIEPAKPTLWIWNTLMSVFVSHRHPDAIQSVRDTMQKYGLEYDMVTWNTIINGTAMSQDAKATAQAIKDMDSQGFTPDQYTLKALRIIHEPELLQTAIKNLDRESERILSMEQETLEREFDDLLDVGLKRIADSSKA